MSGEIRIKLRSFDHKLLDRATKEIAVTVNRIGVGIVGPIPLPRSIVKFTVNKSPHVFKKSREQFEIRTQKRLIIIGRPTPQVINALKKVELAAGVDVEIKLLEA